MSPSGLGLPFLHSVARQRGKSQRICIEGFLPKPGLKVVRIISVHILLGAQAKKETEFGEYTTVSSTSISLENILQFIIFTN